VQQSSDIEIIQQNQLNPYRKGGCTFRQRKYPSRFRPQNRMEWAREVVAPFVPPPLGDVAKVVRISGSVGGDNRRSSPIFLRPDLGSSAALRTPIS
jgi:hypothetical protein